MPDALDSTAEALSRRLLATAPADRPRTALDVDGLPAPVAHLLRARLALAVDDAAPRASEWIGGSDVEAAAADWREAATRAVRFPATVWADAVRQAVRLALAHLVRPAATLADAAFEGETGPLPIGVALDRARAFGPYPYLPQIAARYAERKGVEALGRDEFAGLLQRIDRRMVSTFGPADWMTLLGPLVALVGPVGSPPGTIPTGLLRPLFEARGADSLADVLDGIDAVTADELRARLGATLTPDEPDPTPEARVEDPTAGTPEPSAPQPSAPPSALPADTAEADEPPDLESESAPTTEAAASEPPDSPSAAGETGTLESSSESQRAIATAPPDLHAPPLPPVADGVRPPAIGSRYQSPEYDEAHDSEVLGPARPAAPPPGPEPDEPEGEDGMDEVRDVIAAPREDPRAPDVPVLDLPDETHEADAEVSDDLPPVLADEPPAPTTAEAHEGDEEPLWMRIARRQAEPAAGARDAEEPPAEDSAPDDEPLWKRFAASELAQKLPTPPRDLASSGDLDDVPSSPTLDALEARVLGPGARDRRAWYVEELFEGSPGAYHRTLDRIDRAASYSEATHIVSADIFRAHHVNPYTDSAVAFIDALQVQFDVRR
ncbi:hypothetical protein [Rubrivirga marina]|uniref:Uncharacterized protein n=1 Tax=Rubrivirga marina TaxID=1196024 RepID=A0A271J4H8_9BACT|nr:hypothetical protein [Rubrivirga marina]PAP78412.1 hypothetical protein BSZ37_19280 [Rubrivirga marina]